MKKPSIKFKIVIKTLPLSVQNEASEALAATSSIRVFADDIFLAIYRTLK